MASESSPLLSSASSTEVPEYIDPKYWNPECPNYTVIDWDRWDALNPAPPRVYRPPQLDTYYDEARCIPVWWSHRSPMGFCMPHLAFQLCSPKPRVGYVTDDAFLEELLDQQTASETLPDQFRGLWWMRDNIANETLVSFQSWAWRTTPPNNDKPVALGTIRYNFTNDPTCFGWMFSWGQNERFGLLQVHPNKKWISLCFFTDPTDQGQVSWHWIYVVQDGDEFVTPDGNTVDYLKAGDMIRVTWSTEDPYKCNNDSDLTYMYHVQRIATTTQDGQFQTIQPALQDLRQKATQNTGKQPILCGRCSCNMTGRERVEFQMNNLSNRQQWERSPPPPSADVIDRL